MPLSMSAAPTTSSTAQARPARLGETLVSVGRRSLVGSVRLSIIGALLSWCLRACAPPLADQLASTWGARSAVNFRILGPLEVEGAAGGVDLGAPKQRAVLAMLLIDANRVVPVDRIVDCLWGDDPPARAMGSLQAYVSNLRRALEPNRAAREASGRITTRAPG